MAPGKKEPTKHSFEHSLHRLEEIVDQLERGDIPLEDSIKIYEEGITLSKICVDKLNQAELKVKRLGKTLEGNFELFDIDPEE
ncbi:MAG: exodeoxyribonuclease VII small subunit [Bacteroidota bacterium]